ncbi:AraC-like DNA-binding protein [Filimonas zeae]|uniref:Transcriptional regulator n=1 Tax=Filimonas zeae TaxID=1737353 RepID=A0A917MY70_9BACT|nr:helix-turn-helix domain-containing protein [Filimonas zeae]MDR6341175.1 AraC-like DNA-binding protein [Filimonas zeae]GGH76924.1 transcriptional regulator [Filimonas zeae]
MSFSTLLPHTPRAGFKTDTQPPFYIQSFTADSENGPAPFDTFTRLSRYEIIWFTEGTGTLTVDIDNHSIHDNMIFCLVPGQIRNCQITEPVQGFYISFSEDFLYQTDIYKRGISTLHPYSAVTSASFITVDAAMQQEIEFVVNKMKKEFENYNLLRSEILSGLLYILSTYISRKLEKRADDTISSKDAGLVQQFMQMLRNQYTTMKQVSDYAAELYVSPNYLNRAVKKITGFTASAQIQRHIVMEAKKQAIHTTGSMKEIAYTLGFTDIAHFSKFFKNNSGMSFTNYRKHLSYSV